MLSLVLIQFIHVFSPERLIGFPFNFISYSSKFESYYFQPERLLLSAIFCMVCIACWFTADQYHQRRSNKNSEHTNE
ncbi:hypothetical protein A3K86_15415 [Photobacterium jeanii]|uniref:Uncharacterized protein n=1 Tax=Photobacterium jeanii TaxID=858640 RepID=A0A178K8N3_9GAMM|nr:hypothetical protein A3K86_15415 [Photobacterium jeanii]PST89201.1 hypothetical protein C9I91_13860 [Photobacterium jeanii]